MGGKLTNQQGGTRRQRDVAVYTTTCMSLTPRRSARLTGVRTHALDENRLSSYGSYVGNCKS